MKIGLTAAWFLLCIHSLSARAEEARLPPPVAVVSNVLELNEDQLGALLTMIQARDAALQPLVAEIQKRHETLDQLLRTPEADAATVGRLILEVRALSANAAAIREQAASTFEQILTPEQSANLRHIREAAPVCEIVPAFGAVGLQ